MFNCSITRSGGSFSPERVFLLASSNCSPVPSFLRLLIQFEVKRNEKKYEVKSFKRVLLTRLFLCVSLSLSASLFMLVHKR